ncbi:MAG: ImmA/IrrE family metallo-endopeptidase [Cyanobacteria bacterium J06634_6]
MTHISVPSAPSAPLTMAELYKRLSKLGLSKKYLRSTILPDWWTDEVDQTPGVFTQGALYLSRRLNLDIDSLLIEETPRFITSGQPKFKTIDGTCLAELRASESIASCVAETVAAACSQPYQDITQLSVSQIRQQILSDRSSVDLVGLLQFCWSQGIPVVHVAQYPSILQRFHGMVTTFQGRPVIVISRRDRSPAWLLFIIAHELGHILCNHLSTDGLIVDQEIQLTSDDAEENEANQAAAELLLGRSGISYDVWNKFLKGEVLATKAQQFAQESQNDPGVIAVNIAWNRAQRAKTKRDSGIAWVTGMKALKILEPNANAPTQINQYLFQSIDWDLLREDSQEYLRKMLGPFAKATAKER